MSRIAKNVALRRLWLEPVGLGLSTYNCPMASKGKGKPQPDQDQLESEWARIGLSGPARRALVEAKLYKVSDLRRITLEELYSLHGMGKSSVARIQVIMRAKKIPFASH